MMNGNAGGFVIALSGGQDSTTCLFWALANLPGPGYAMIADYGQRHRTEIRAARGIATKAGVDSITVPLTMLAGSSLTQHSEDVNADGGYLGLPSSYTPGRNLLILTTAAQIAFKRGAHHIVTGVCQTDYSGYPDCRAEFVRSLERTLALGMDWPFKIHAPLMYLTKRQTVELARDLGCLPALAFSVTCYHGDRPGCGDCPSCKLRARGFEEAGLLDPARADFGVDEVAKTMGLT